MNSQNQNNLLKTNKLLKNLESKQKKPKKPNNKWQIRKLNYTNNLRNDQFSFKINYTITLYLFN